MQAISVQDAVKNAKKSLKELYADDPLQDLALEEVEFVQLSERPVWLVTLGFHRPKSVSAVQPSGGMHNFLPVRAVQIENRVYKIVSIDANTGDFVKMDMRQVQ